MEKIKIGIFGAQRGSYFNPAILREGGEIVAVCERLPQRTEWMKYQLRAAGASDDIAFYTDFDEFINHEMDAVLLINNFNEHAKFAIKCLEKGIHVLCECQSNVTMADGVALVRAAEKSKAHFMLLENYPYMLFNLEMKKIVEEGSLGKILYAEGEYNHSSDKTNYAPDDTTPMRMTATMAPYEKHWRRFNSRAFYLTHSLAPLMHITGAWPKRVTAMPVFAPTNGHSMVGDRATVMTTLNDNDSVFKFFGCSAFGFTEDSYRFCGEYGQVENVRGSGGKVMLSYSKGYQPEGTDPVTFYKPEWKEEDREIALKSGHHGGDYFIIKKFFNVVRGLEKNEFDVYFSTTLASTAILAHRSQLEYGVPYDIPDFRKEEDRVKWENDTLTPYYSDDGGEPTLPCCSRPDYRPSEESVKKYREALEWYYSDKNPDYMPSAEELKAYTMPMNDGFEEKK